MLFFEKFFRHVFRAYGRLLTTYHWIFLIVTIVITIAMIPGLTLISYEGNVFKLLTPDDARSKQERAVYKELFRDVGNRNILPSRLITGGRQGQVIFQANHDLNILTTSIMHEVLSLHWMIMNITVYDGDNDEHGFQFEDLCLQWEDECLENDVLDLYDYDAEKVGNVNTTYPYTMNSAGIFYYVASNLGGVTIDVDHTDDQGNAPVEHVKVIRLTYFLRTISHHGAGWEREFQTVVRSFKSERMKIVSSTSQVLNQETDATTTDLINLGIVTICALFIFCPIACMMADWVLSKPWLGIAGLLTVFMSLITAFGVMGYCGITFVFLAGATPFLIIGIGLDDTYVALSAWRKTNPDEEVESRLGETLAEAAISITITSLTDALAFGIGAISTFPAIRHFSIYCLVAVTFCYFYQLFFFAPCLALSGHREIKMRQACCFCYTTNNIRYYSDHKIPFITNFFKNIYGPFLNNEKVMTSVILVFLGYLGISLWGCTLIELGLPAEKLVRDGSEALEYYKLTSEYFSSTPRITMIVTNRIDYSDPNVQYDLEYALSAMEFNEHVLDKERMLTVSWLRSYLQFLQNECLVPLSSLQFTDVLREQFLTKPQYKPFTLDIIFNEDNTSIVSSRFFMSTEDTAKDHKYQTQIASDLRNKADESPLPLMVYSSIFSDSDQYLSMWQSTWQSLGVTFAIMFVVSLLLIPYPGCAFIVTLSIASIAVGVMGFMSLWQINISPPSMINLILCIGFSVDFSAHICYAYVIGADKVEDRFDGDPEKEKDCSDSDVKVQCGCYIRTLPEKPTNKERSIYSLYSLGFPVVQGAVSTILSVLALVFSTAYVFQVFFKTMFLVIILGTIHALVFIPVILRIFVGKGEQYILEFLGTITSCFVDLCRACPSCACTALFIMLFLIVATFMTLTHTPVLIEDIAVHLPSLNPMCL